MPNTLGAYNPIIYANEALDYLKNTLGVAGRIYMGYDRERATVNKGDTVQIRRPAKLIVEDSPAVGTDLTTEFVNITLDKHREVKFAVTDKELAFTGPDVRQNPLVQDHIMPAVYEIANDMDATCAAAAQTVSHTVVRATTAAPPVIATDATISDILKVWRKLFDLKAPTRDQANMHFLIGGQEYATLAALPAFSQWQGAGQVGVNTQISNMLGTRYGFNFFADQNRKTNTYATITDSAGATGAIAAKGATTLNVTGLGAAEVYNKGTIIKFTNGAEAGNQYSVTANATMTAGANAAVAITPPLRVGAASGDLFAIGDTIATNDTDLNPTGVIQSNSVLNENLAFHRNWLACATGKLPDYAEFPGQLGANIGVAQDPQTGLTVRVRIFYEANSSKMKMAVDVLWGIKEINPEYACRYEVKAA